jgi:hypothetical protein
MLFVGHAMCRVCVKRLAKKECPQCKRSFVHANLRSNLFVQGMVWQLRVKCRQHDYGCRWTGELGVDGHNLTAHDADCPFKLVECNVCYTIMSRIILADHPTQCPMRQLNIAHRVCMT